MKSSHSVCVRGVRGVVLFGKGVENFLFYFVHYRFVFIHRILICNVSINAKILMEFITQQWYAWVDLRAVPFAYSVPYLRYKITKSNFVFS